MWLATGSNQPRSLLSREDRIGLHSVERVSTSLEKLWPPVSTQVDRVFHCELELNSTGLADPACLAQATGKGHRKGRCMGYRVKLTRK